MTTPPLTPAQLDRARGALAGTAVGDALGAPLEFGPVVPYPTPVVMTGGGPHGGTPGQWTDDTAMTLIIADAAARHGGLHPAALDDIAVGFVDWARTAPDVGIQTRTVFGELRGGPITAARMTQVAADYAARTARADGNGSLMRTAPIALATLQGEDTLVHAARAVSALTHAADDSTDACVIWSGAMRHAVLHGTLDGVRASVALLPAGRQARWHALLDEAEAHEPWHFTNNGWVVHAVQAAWAAITCTRPHEGAPASAFSRALDHAVRCGSDTDTVGAIAGMLLGAVHGVEAMPADWVAVVHGWPGRTGADLIALADTMVTGAA